MAKYDSDCVKLSNSRKELGHKLSRRKGNLGMNDFNSDEMPQCINMFFSQQSALKFRMHFILSISEDFS